MVEPQRAEVAGIRPDRNLRIAREGRRLVARHVLPIIDLTSAERLRRCHRLGDIEPLDPVDLDQLAARCPARRLFAREVVRVLDVDHPMAELPFIFDEFEGSRADRLLDLGVGVGLRQPLGQSKRRRRGQRSQRLEHWEGFLQSDAEIFVGDRLDRRRRCQQRLAVGVVALAPALQRGDDIGRPDRRAVVKF